MLVSVGNYDNKDQKDQLETECRQNHRLKFMAKNPYRHLNAIKGVQMLAFER